MLSVKKKWKMKKPGIKEKTSHPHLPETAVFWSSLLFIPCTYRYVHIHIRGILLYMSFVGIILIIKVIKSYYEKLPIILYHLL